MSSLYSKPLRVYLIMVALAAWGILSGAQLPVSLFPTSSQARVQATVSYGSLSPRQFYESVGRRIEEQIQSIKVKQIGIERLRADYGDRNVRYTIRFNWGADAEEVRRLVETAASSQLAGQDEAIRRSLNVDSWSENQGFFAVSFFSPLRSLDEVYELLHPLTTPMGAKVGDASSIGLFNPSSKEITLEVSPEKLALHQLTTRQVETALSQAILSLGGGTIKIGDNNLQLTLPKQAVDVSDLATIRVSSVSQTPVLLKDIAKISIAVSEERKVRFKTSGVESLILFANPKEGGNIKRMSDDIVAELAKIKPQIPEDIEFRVLVNPSDFIDESVSGVVREVGLAAFLAVVVLFFFIGSFKNVATAAIEIPLSLVMAFILMKLTGMNLNLISLGGLALSAGMNVDASVVVLENIVRHFDKHKRVLSRAEQLRVILGAVNEVKAPIIASTIASLVVFIPLIFTQGLTNSLLGDLAKAVVFSHGLSAVVALILVPTVRYQLMGIGAGLTHSASPIEGWLKKLEAFYARTLGFFLRSWRTQVAVFTAILILLPVLIFSVVPKLKKEVIGRPDTDWLIVGINNPQSSSLKQIEADVETLETEVFKSFADDIRYTFTQISGASNGQVMMRLKSRHGIDKHVAKAEALFKSSPTLFYWVEQWNPSELEIPDPPDFELAIVGGSSARRRDALEDIRGRLTDLGIFDNVRASSGLKRTQFISIRPATPFTTSGESLPRYDLSHFLRTATEGIYLSEVSLGTKMVPIYLRFPKARTASLEQLKALPIGVDGRLIPVGAVAQFSMKPKDPEIYRENLSEMATLSGRMDKANASKANEHKKRALEVVNEYRQKIGATQRKLSEEPSLNLLVPDRELQDALRQLKWAVLISMALVFLTMVIQLGDIVQASLVMVAIPLGLIGVIVSLFAFNSSLSLNSGLGSILLNGIAVANSIILVDFIQKLFNDGRAAFEATIEASSARLRPILMTSLTTVLGMLPIALGLGEGGKILQPLGIAVSGGLWVSALMTLYIVPALQYRWLARKERKLADRVFRESPANLDFVEDRAKSDHRHEAQL